jgi:aspartate kinase
MFALLAEAGVNIKLITTSEIKVSCLIDGALVQKAVQCLHTGFNLDRVE